MLGQRRSPALGKRLMYDRLHDRREGTDTQAEGTSWADKGEFCICICILRGSTHYCAIAPRE